MLLLLDTASLYFRAFYGVPDTFRSPDGQPVNAIRGLLDYIARLVEDRRPTQLVAAMDESWRPSWRVEKVPSYKTHRVAPDSDGIEEAVPDELSPQVPVICEVLDAIGIARVGAPDYEADDVIGTLAKQADGPVEIVTGDRDLFQLVDDRVPIRVVYVAKGVNNREIVDEAEVTRRYGIPGRAYADFATLRGDPSDGLPGVPGVGEKTAAALINRFGTIDAVVEAAAGDGEGFPKGSQAKVLGALDYLAGAIDVVRVATDAPVPRVDDLLPHVPKDPDRLDELAERWGIASPVRRVVQTLAQATEE
ncbi:MAG TPA: 5'-3' exonuclease H3TH domain-containing protein [Mycobacteriales bacterium]|nr:5'-3' exonuclease H3TH domain-containing protein [Mycobacteriales bacterium]